MDKLFIGDIPSEYHYARFGDNYIDLYKVQNLTANTEYDYYRVYLYDNTFIYSHNVGVVGYYSNYINTDIEVTDNVMYRRDIDSIFICTFIICLIGLMLINIVTSCVKRGGIFGGLI